MLTNTCINYLCTQLSRSQQSSTNLKQHALLNHKTDVNNDVLINPCISRDMIKSVHNEIDKNYHVPKTDSYFVGQKRNKVNRISLTIQYLSQVFDNKKQLINIDIEYLFSFSR